MTGEHKNGELGCGVGDDIKKQIKTPKYCKKYVYFDLRTGEKLFEWGGIRDPMRCKYAEQNDK